MFIRLITYIGYHLAEKSPHQHLPFQNGFLQLLSVGIPQWVRDFRAVEELGVILTECGVLASKRNIYQCSIFWIW